MYLIQYVSLHCAVPHNTVAQWLRCEAPSHYSLPIGVRPTWSPCDHILISPSGNVNASQVEPTTHQYVVAEDNFWHRITWSNHDHIVISPLPSSPLVFTKPVVLLQIHHIEIMAHFATEYRSTLRPKWESHCIVNCEKVHVTALWRPWTSTLWSEHIFPTQLCWPVLWLLGYNRRSGDQLRRSRGENPIKQMMTLSPVHGSCPVAPARWCSEPRPLGDQSSKLHLRATILCLSDQLKSDQSWLAYKQSDL